MLSLKARSLQEQLQALGEYRLGDVPVVYDPLLMRNERLSAATLAHEEMHRKLTFHSTYGTFWQILTYNAARGQFQQELALCLEGQWGVQEAAATYAQLS